MFQGAGAKNDINALVSLIKNMESASSISFYNSKYRNEKVTHLLELYNIYNNQPQKNTENLKHILRTAENELMNGLFLSPANSNYWYLLAEVRAKLYTADSKLNELLKMSYFLGPREGWIARRRLLFVLNNWEITDRKVRRLAYKDIVLLWNEKYYQKHLAEIFLATGKLSKKIIYKEINKNGYDSIKHFTKVLKSKGYKSKNSLLYTILF